MNIFNKSYGKWVEYYHDGATPFSILPSLLRGALVIISGGSGSVALLILRIYSEGNDLFFSGSIVNLQHLLLGAGSCGC